MLTKIISLFTLLIELHFSLARIQIDVYLNKTILVNCTGVDLKPLSDLEMSLFNISDYKIKEGFKEELGKEPNDIFYKDPTYYGNLYKKYKWNEVKRKMRVNETKILYVLKEDAVLKSHALINNTTRTSKVKRAISETVEEAVTSFWPDNQKPVDNIIYNLNVSFEYGNMSTEIEWKKKNWDHVYLPIRFTASTKLTPGQTTIFELLAHKITVVIEVTYEASLVGNVIGNYAHTYGKYHFWAPSIENIMRAANLNNKIYTRELIEIRGFTDPRLKMSETKFNRTFSFMKSCSSESRKN